MYGVTGSTKNQGLSTFSDTLISLADDGFRNSVAIYLVTKSCITALYLYYVLNLNNVCVCAINH